MSQIDDLVLKTNKVTSNNRLPAMAFWMNAFGSVSNLELWNILQTDLLHKNLYVNKTNLYLNYHNNAILKAQTFQLDNINSQLQELKNIIVSQASNEERENHARELIYNIRKFNDSLAESSDKIYISYEATALLEMIKQHEISTASFPQIADKEYFDSLFSELKQKSDGISEDEKLELEGFVSVYMYTLELIKEFEKLHRIKLIHFPESVESVEKPELPKNSI